MDWMNLIGIVAGICTTAAFVPQVLMVWRTRSARDISLAMYAIFVLGITLWLVYGVMARALPVILANGATLLLAGAVLVMKLHFDARRPPMGPAA
ncbi:SemiSWEET transporter [Chitiniphilus purpureus]|uniref:SemiSWEET transporter n=1 Tax=Chitiniphilus purpureus TaxID=2981137 RepID=A0ABY6DN48_9NEIS|nr:SemiSWEET transporter [Chitiniphilus sp. CD1]UXY14541.1 SemiSWEET transporter [Chitiniphilus sp. CD1]